MLSLSSEIHNINSHQQLYLDQWSEQSPMSMGRKPSAVGVVMGVLFVALIASVVRFQAKPVFFCPVFDTLVAIATHYLPLATHKIFISGVVINLTTHKCIYLVLLDSSWVYIPPQYRHLHRMYCNQSLG